MQNNVNLKEQKFILLINNKLVKCILLINNFKYSNGRVIFHLSDGVRTRNLCVAMRAFETPVASQVVIYS